MTKNKIEKVYIITKGDYSSYHICAATLDAKRAEKLRELYSARNEEAKIEEFELDMTKDGNVMFAVLFDGSREPDVEVRAVEEFDACLYLCDDPDVEGISIDGIGDMTVTVLAPDKDRALKIAQDRRAEFLARREGIT